MDTLLKLNKALLKKAFMVAVVSVMVSACSSPEQDAEVREEPPMAVDAQSPVEMDATQTNTTQDSASAPGITLDDNITTAPAMDDAIVGDANVADANSIEAQESATIDAATLDNTPNGTQDNADVIDGTDQEENVSTY